MDLIFYAIPIIIFIIFIFLEKGARLLYAIIFTVFLEANIFSFYFLGARIRVIQILEIIGFFYFFSRVLARKATLRKTPIDMFLWSYIGINFLALINAIWMSRSMKISILLLSLAVLYHLIYNLIETKDIFKRALDLLIYVGLFEILYGLYQVFAGIINWCFNANLPIGYLSMAHVEYIGSPWGRPYGTLVESDWYGAICMFYALLFALLCCTEIKKKKLSYFLMLNISVIGLFLSFVRAAWLGFIFGVLFSLFFKYKYKNLEFNMRIYIRNLFIVSMIIFTMVIISPQIRSILKGRFSDLNSKNIRLVLMQRSIQTLQKHILIGNGPGSSSFSYLAQEKGKKYAKKFIKTKNALLKGNEGFDHSIISTVLTDTGIFGLIIFLLLIAKIIIFNFKAIPLLHQEYQLAGLGLFLGIIGLFISYIFTQGLWIPFTWVFLAFNMATIRWGLKEI